MSLVELVAIGDMDIDLAAIGAQEKTNFLYVKSLHDLVVLRAVPNWRKRHGGRKPKGMISFDINGLCTTLGEHHFDPRLAQAIEEADRRGYMVCVSTANDYESAVEYVKYIGVADNLIALWNCGNGKAVYCYKGDRTLCHTVIPLKLRAEHKAMMESIYYGLMEVCETEGIHMEFVHPVHTRRDRPGIQPSGVYALVEQRDDPCVNVSFLLWDAQNRTWQPAPEGLVKRIGARIENDILPANGFNFNADGVEIDSANNFVYIVGYTTMRGTRKAEYLVQVSRYLKDEFGDKFVVTHAGDNHNEFGCEQLDRLWIPADAHPKLFRHLAMEALPYDPKLETTCPSAAVEYVHEFLLAYDGEGLPKELWP